MNTHAFIASLLLLAGCTSVSSSVADEPAPGPALIVEPDPAEEPQSPAAPATDTRASFVPLTRGQGPCEVRIVAILEAEEYRGPGPLTPAVAASLDADPDYAAMYNSESHGDHHIQCHYEVALGHLPDARFRWRSVHGNTLRDRSPEICADPKQVAAVAEDIIETTEQCTAFDAGAYWGYVLDPL